MPIHNFSEDTFPSKKYTVQLTNNSLMVLALSKAYLYGEIILILKAGHITLICPVSTNFLFYVSFSYKLKSPAALSFTTKYTFPSSGFT